MMEYIGVFLVLVAAIFGISEFFRFLQRKLVYKKHRPVTISVLPLSGRIDDAELIVRDLLETMKWQSEASSAAVILIDLGMDEETRQVCGYLCREYECVTLCRQEELHQSIEQLIAFKKA